MSEEDFRVVCSKIDEVREFLESVSRDIWDHPELALKEFRAHDTLTGAFKRSGFQVQENYILQTAFRAEYQSRASGGPTIAVLLEYDALPEIGHACGHNLIAEAGLAASLGIKAAMEADETLQGKLVVLGTPAEESVGGKIPLLKAGALGGVDAAMMVHPSSSPLIFCNTLAQICFAVNFKGKEAHAAASPWEGRNALDAAVSAYHNIALLRQQMKPDCRIHAILTRGGTMHNIIPGEASMELGVRTPTRLELQSLLERTKECVEAGARAAGCVATFEEKFRYDDLVTNRVMAEVYKGYAEKLGFPGTVDAKDFSTGSTDMGNVSHCVPSIHPFYILPTTSPAHSRGFTAVAGSLDAQPPTLAAAKAMAMTALTLMRRPEELLKAKEEFKEGEGM